MPVSDQWGVPPTPRYSDTLPMRGHRLFPGIIAARRRIFFSRAIYPLTLAVLLPAVAGCGTGAAEDVVSTAGVVTVIPAAIDFGVVSSGQRLTETATVRNDSGREIQIRAIRSSCECAAVSPGTFVLPPNAERELSIDVDLSADPEFHGALGIEAQGVDVNGQDVFQFKIAMTVSKPAYSPLTGE